MKKIIIKAINIAMAIVFSASSIVSAQVLDNSNTQYLRAPAAAGNVTADLTHALSAPPVETFPWWHITERKVAKYIAELSGTRDERYRAAIELGRLGKHAEPSIPYLIKVMLSDEEKGLRTASAASLGAIGIPSQEVVSALNKALEDSEYDVRVKAMRSLAALDKLTVEMKVKRYIMDMGDADPNVRANASKELYNIGYPAIPIIEARKNSNEVLAKAVDSLYWRILRGKLFDVENLMRQLEGENKAAQERASDIFFRLGNEAVPILIEALGSNKHKLRLRVSEILFRIGLIAADDLANALKEDDLYIRTYSADVLTRLGIKSAPFVIRELGNRTSNARFYVKSILLRLGPEVIPMLSDVLNIGDNSACEDAIDILEEFSKQLPERNIVLIRALGHNNWFVREQALKAIKRIGLLTKDMELFKYSKDLKDEACPGFIKQDALRGLSVLPGPGSHKIVTAFKTFDPDLGHMRENALDDLAPGVDEDKGGKSSSAGILELDKPYTLTEYNLLSVIDESIRENNGVLANTLIESKLSAELIRLCPKFLADQAGLERNHIVAIDDKMLPEGHIFNKYLLKDTAQHQALEESHGCMIRLLSQLTTDELTGRNLIIISDRRSIEGYEKALYLNVDKQRIDAGLLLAPYIGIARLLLSAREDIVIDITNALNKDNLYSMLFGRPAKEDDIRKFLIEGIYELPAPAIVNYQQAEDMHRASLAALIAA
ncbi:MAG: HEAT repeat domain-containing protein [Candidatus Omnitrophica bacterium]|nr:HEAT repeat domain-containing protein [Candidatus Omnitrophota bacterium]